MVFYLPKYYLDFIFVILYFVKYFLDSKFGKLHILCTVTVNVKTSISKLGVLFHNNSSALLKMVKSSFLEGKFIFISIKHKIPCSNCTF